MSETLIPDPFLFADKPSGVSTHRPSPELVGFVEWLSLRDQKTYKVCHRLDKETSGAMVFSDDKAATAVLGELFAQHKVKKEYLFVSPQKSKEKKWEVKEREPVKESVRVHSKKNLLSENKKKALDSSLSPVPEGQMGFKGGDSVTVFERLNDEGSLFLYKALPLTGKTHQIRKHAVRSGIPILGDTEYGGEAFSRLMLHSLKIEFLWQNELKIFESKASRLFTSPQLCHNLQLSTWIVGIERREFLFNEIFHSSSESMRLLHTEGEDLRIDKVGEKILMGWWRNSKPTAIEEQNIKELMKIFDFQNWCLIWHPGVAHEESGRILFKSEIFSQEDWTFTENQIHFKASLKKGQNFGLFLDQRNRRWWLKNQCENKSVLNLFSFTCGFSLYAALGGASQVVSVDLFSAYLDWGKENFSLNGLNPQTSSYEFRAMDTFEYLKFAQKKSLRFDYIICDPPSFSRHKKLKSVFRVEKDFPILLESCAELLKPGGFLLFSTNYERWDAKKWSAQMSLYLKINKLTEVEFPEVSYSQWDFEWQKDRAHLKTFLLKKQNFMFETSIAKRQR